MNGSTPSGAVNLRAKGGLAVLAKYGREHFREIGKRGYQVGLAKVFQGDRHAYRRWLSARGWNAAIDRAADAELDRRIADGAEISLVELPPYLDDEADDDILNGRDEDARHQDLYQCGILPF